MGWLDSLEKKSYGWSGTVDLTDERLGAFVGGERTASSKPVNDTTAMKVSAAWGCIRLIAETLGSLPRAFFEKQSNGNMEKVEGFDLAMVLDNPNADMTGVEFIEAKTANLVFRGNAYSLKGGTRSDGVVTSLYPMPAADVREEWKNDGTRVYKFLERGKWETYPADKVWHWKGFSFNGRSGLSPLAYAREAFGMALAAEEFAAKLFANGAMPSMLVTIPEWLKPGQRQEAKEIINEMWAGLVNAHKPMLLQGGMKVEKGMFPPEELQFIALRDFQVRDICRFYRVDPRMVGDIVRDTYASREQGALEFVMLTMLPYLTRVEASVQKFLLPPAMRGRMHLKFNFDGLLRADSTARAALYAILLQNGVLSRNEVRALENRNRSDDEGMDDYTVQLNMSPIDQLVATLIAQANAPRPRQQPTGSAPTSASEALKQLRDKGGWFNSQDLIIH